MRSRSAYAETYALAREAEEALLTPEPTPEAEPPPAVPQTPGVDVDTGGCESASSP